MPPMDYRVVSRDGRYVAQVAQPFFLFWGKWQDLFRGEYTGFARTFETPKEAMEAVRDLHMRQQRAAPRNYEQTFYIALNGQICPTQDYER
jgi:hypothetical protein